jgi:hypothetical protein
MTARPESRATARRQAARPADKFFQKSLTAWFAQWKAQKANIRSPGRAQSRPLATTGATSA